tara:strand:- start:60 stop:218 length:159 start_codon:yes stop_codon:yes gene_type:complete
MLVQMEMLVVLKPLEQEVEQVELILAEVVVVLAILVQQVLIQILQVEMVALV